jgi:major type 1 subunit fimbrin (pilin)
MNKIMFALMAAGTVIGASPDASAADGTLTFTGKITEATCTVTGTGGAVGSGTVAVALDTFSKATLDAANKTVGDKPFQIALSGADCTDGKIYKMGFQGGGANADANGNLNNSLTGVTAATNVQVRLLNATGQVVNFKTDANGPVSTAIAGNNGTIDLTAQYMAYPAAATAGDLSTSVEFVLSHN